MNSIEDIKRIINQAGGFDPIVGFPNSSPTATYISTSVITAGWAGFTTLVESIATVKDFMMDYKL